MNRKTNEKAWQRIMMRTVLTVAALVVWAVFLPMRAEAAQTGTIPGTMLTYSYDEGTKTLTISGTGELGDRLHDTFQSMEIKKIQFQNCKVTGA